MPTAPMSSTPIQSTTNNSSQHSTQTINSSRSRKKILMLSLAMNVMLTILYVNVFTASESNNNSSTSSSSSWIFSSFITTEKPTTTTNSDQRGSTLLSLDGEDVELNEKHHLLWENIFFQNPIDPVSHCLRGPLFALEDEVETVFQKILLKINLLEKLNGKRIVWRGCSDEWISKNSEMIVSIIFNNNQSSCPSISNQIIISRSMEEKEINQEKINSEIFLKELDSKSMRQVDVLEFKSSSNLKEIENLLELMSSKMIVVKFNPILPPPLIRNDSNQHSLGWLLNILDKYGFSLIWVAGDRAVFVKNKFVSLFGSIPRSPSLIWYYGFYNNSDYSTTLLDRNSNDFVNYFSNSLHSSLITKEICSELDLNCSCLFHNSINSSETSSSSTNNNNNTSSCSLSTFLRNPSCLSDSNHETCLATIDVLIFKLSQSIINEISSSYIPSSRNGITISHIGSAAIRSLDRSHSRKSFVYLIPNSQFQRLKEIQQENDSSSSSSSSLIELGRDLESPNSEVITFDDSNIPDQVIDKNEIWSKMVNELANLALSREQSQGWRFKFFVFINIDGMTLERSNGGVSSLRSFEWALETYEPALSGPFSTLPLLNSQWTYQWRQNKPSWFSRMEPNWMIHPSLFSIHREAIHSLLPLPEVTHSVHNSLAFSIMIQRSKILFPTSTMQWLDVSIHSSSFTMPPESFFSSGDLEKYFKPSQFPTRLKNCFAWNPSSNTVRFATPPNPNFPKLKKIHYDSVTYYNVQNLYC